MGVIKNIAKALMGTATGVTPSITQGEITYTGDSAARLFNLQVSATDAPSATSNGISDPIAYWDIAQSHFFTVQIYSSAADTASRGYNQATGLHDLKGNPFSFCSGEGTYRDYVPIKTMNFNYTNYDNMTLPVNIFGDFPLLHRKKMTTINISCYDMDQDVIERALKYWENQCFPNNCVEYMDCVKADFKYRSYDVTGKMNFEQVLEVIPTGAVSTNRSYEENAPKMLNFSLIVVGASGKTAKGPKAGAGPVLKERGLGDGNERADYTYEKKVSLIYNTQGGIENQNEIYADDMR